MILFLLSFQLVPVVKQQQDASETYFISKLTLNCVYKSGSSCEKSVQENFNFFMNAAFLAGTPLEENEYIERFNATQSQVIKNVDLTIEDDPGNVLDVLSQTETYSIDISEGKIVIKAQNFFSVSRAFQTFMQLIKTGGIAKASSDASPDSNNQRYSYTIRSTKVTDGTQTKWRSISLDACSHFVPTRDITRFIDSASLLKANILILNLLCNHSAPFNFKDKQLEWVSKCSWSSFHFYDEDDLSQLQKYAMNRGVIIVPQLNIPFEGAVLAKADQQFLVRGKVDSNQDEEQKDQNEPQNYGWIAVNDDSVGSKIKKLVDAIDTTLFSSVKVKPIIHFGGAQVAAVGNQQPADPKELLTSLNKLINPQIIKVIDSNAINHFNSFNQTNTIVHFTIDNDRRIANEKGFKQISSYNLFTHQMHPGGGYHYFWQDTWYDLARQNVFTGSDNNLGIGGGIIQTGDHCYGRSCEQHMFQRCFAVYDKLWTGPDKQNTQSSYIYEALGCHFEAAGIGNGPLEIGAPCPGYQGKQL